MVQAEVSYCSLTRVAFGRGRNFGGPLFCCFFLFISLLPGGLALRLLILENQVFRGDLTLPIFLKHICDKPLGKVHYVIKEKVNISSVQLILSRLEVLSAEGTAKEFDTASTEYSRSKIKIFF